MAIPAPAIPSGNAYTVNVAHPVAHPAGFPSAPAETSGIVQGPLATFAAAAALLLRRYKIPVRLHASGDSPRLTALRGFLIDAGAKASGFSPSPSAEIPGEGFWKTTVVVVEARPNDVETGTDKTSVNFWASSRTDKKVEWDPLLAALAVRCSPADFPPAVLAAPDLWCVWNIPEADAKPEQAPPESLAAAWVKAGAAAVCVMTPFGFAWQSNSAVFGQSSGQSFGQLAGNSGEQSNGSMNDSASPPPEMPGVFAAGIVAGILQDLLEENLFEKTLVRADRECLEIRPLRLGRACLGGIAALQAAEGIAAVQAASEARAGNSGDVFQKSGGLAERAQQHLAQLRGPESKPWGSKGR